jgi:hypothetical protein
MISLILRKRNIFEKKSIFGDFPNIQKTTKIIGRFGTSDGKFPRLDSQYLHVMFSEV